MSTDQTNETTQPNGDSGNFNVWVIALLVIMLVSLIGLWVVEKGRTARAYSELSQMNEYIAKQKGQMNKLGMALAQQAAGQIDPASLSRQKHQFDGKDVNVMVLDEFTAKNHGLKSGDVLLVVENSPLPASLPTR